MTAVADITAWSHDWMGKVDYLLNPCTRSCLFYTELSQPWPIVEARTEFQHIGIKKIQVLLQGIFKDIFYIFKGAENRRPL